MAEQPNFDISPEVGTRVIRRLADFTEDPINGYCFPVIDRMYRDHLPLSVLLKEMTKPEDLVPVIKAGRIMGACQAYDAITEQLRAEKRRVRINAEDLRQYAVDLYTEGSLKPLVKMSSSEAQGTIREAMQDAQRGKLPDLGWFINSLKLKSPNYHLFVGAVVNEVDNPEHKRAFLVGISLPSIIFYRKLGLLGN